MTPSEQAKREGLRSLSRVSELTGVSPQTLANWHKDKPDLFQIVLQGCVMEEIRAGVLDGLTVFLDRSQSND